LRYFCGVPPFNLRLPLLQPNVFVRLILASQAANPATAASESTELARIFEKVFRPGSFALRFCAFSLDKSLLFSKRFTTPPMLRARFLPTVLIVLAGQLSAQTSVAVQHPGSICCDQNLCPGEPIGMINEVLPAVPDSLEIEYAWFELVLDDNSPSGTAWRVILNSNTPNFQPTAINNPFGGFFQRGARPVGGLYYLNSNIATVKYFPVNSPECTSSTQEPAAAQALLLAPNPVSEQLVLNNLGDLAEPAQVRIFSIEGRFLRQLALPAQSSTTLDVASWANGHYLAQIQYADGRSVVRRWVKI